MNYKNSALFSNYALLFLFICALLRFICFFVLCGERSLQVDFSAFYTAGESLNAGLSPYENYITYTPPLWDGIDTYKHSRFLYPHLVANTFQIVAHIPYYYAKYIWMILNIAFLIISLVLAVRILNLHLSVRSKLCIGLLVLLFYPLRPFLERGQIDSLTLLLINLALYFMLIRRQNLISGVIFAIATLFKLHIVFLVPFLLLRRKWTIIIGYIFGGIIIICLTLALNGKESLEEYVYVRLPRIAQFGEGGTEEMKLSDETITSVANKYKQGLTIKDGIQYRKTVFDFVSNATLVRIPAATIVHNFFEYFGITNTKPLVSILFLLVFCCILVLYGRHHGFPALPKTSDEYIYWQIVLIIILLCAPLTWAMNTIWLLPAILILINEESQTTERYPAQKSLKICAVGFLLAMVPDQYVFPMLPPFFEDLMDYKYVLAELFLFSGLLLLLGSRYNSELLRHNEKSQNKAMY